MKDRSFIVIVVLLLLAAAVTWQLYFKEYHQADTVSIHIFPNEIAGWTAKEIPISDGDYAILETRNAFVRRYTNPAGQFVDLFIIYSQNNRKVSHPPEICYTGSGATILSSVTQMIPLQVPAMTIRANKLTVEQRNNQQFMYYWFKVGDTFTSNYWQQQMLIALKTVTGKPASSALIRLSSDINPDYPQKNAALIEDFTRAITPLLFKYLP